MPVLWPTLHGLYTLNDDFHADNYWPFYFPHHICHHVLICTHPFWYQFQLYYILVILYYIEYWVLFKMYVVDWVDHGSCKRLKTEKTEKAEMTDKIREWI